MLSDSIDLIQERQAVLSVYATGPNPERPLDALRVAERPEPAVGPRDVAVNVRAASVNMHDVWTLRGVGIRPDQFPMTLGMDGAGTLDDGTEVVIHSVIASSDWRGDETLDPRRSCLTEGYQGTFAERVVVPRANVVAKPSGMSFEEGACMGVAWLTAYRMLFVKSRLIPGQTILVQGASGGVSTALIQLAHAAGFRVWVTGRSETKKQAAVDRGADAVFDTGERLPERVDGVFDSVGRATWSHSIKSLRPGGVLVTCGATSGDVSGAELNRIFYLQLRVEGSTMGTRSELGNLIRFCDTAGVRPFIGATYQMSSARDAFDQMLTGDVSGKIVLTN